MAGTLQGGLGSTALMVEGGASQMSGSQTIIWKAARYLLSFVLVGDSVLGQVQREEQADLT